MTTMDARATLSPTELRELYEQMVLIRVFETESERQYKAAKIGGYCHLSSGQEATTVGVIHTMQIFQEAFIMTPGGQPVDSTLFYAYNLFRQAFQYFRMGYASAMAWILFVVVFSLTLFQLWLSKRWVHYERT